MKIHLLGPSGSGVTTLGRALSKKYAIAHFDTDDFFWIETDPPFQLKRPVSDRVILLRGTLNAHSSWVLSGSALEWGDFLLDEADLIIYLYINKDIRIKRLLKREIERFGDRIKPSNDMHQSHKEFIEWATSYEDGGINMRSKLSETNWLKKAKGRILMIESEMPVLEEMEMVEDVLNELSQCNKI